MLKTELHVHTHFSPDCATPPEKLVARCQKLGINCLAVTDHNTIQGAFAVQKLAPFQVIIGEEVKSNAGEITGLFLTEEIPQGLSPMETVKEIKEQGGLVSIPHPFDKLRRSVIVPDALKEVLPYADIVEVFNARNTFSSANDLAMALAHKHDLLMTSVSDSHTLLELGRCYVEIPQFDGTPAGFMNALTKARLVTRKISPAIHIATTFTKFSHRLRGK